MKIDFSHCRRYVLACSFAASLAFTGSVRAGTPQSSAVVPATDPAPEGKVPEMVQALRGKHPRLLLTESTLPRLREFYKSDAGAPWRQKIENYLPACSVPKDTKFLTDATDAQRQGLWRLPTVAMHYLMTGERKSLEQAKGFLELFLTLPDWETGTELNSGMGAANIMIGAALAYDWLYHELDPEFRQKFRDKLLWHARSMFHGGHLMKNPGVHYWQNDPANNHRWHRNAGLILSILAIYEAAPEEQWILQQGIKDLDFVSKWLPQDGTCHEGPEYLTFGGNHLVLAMDAADRCLGTNFLENPYLKNTSTFRTQLLLGGFNNVFRFGDCSEGGIGGYNNFFLKGVSINKQPDVKDALLRMLEKNPKSFEFGWFSLLWDDPAVPRGNVENLPVTSFWPDIGFATMRESWKDNAVAASFKCGPFGGYDLNRFAAGGKYINVAHDDPDANEFLIAIGGNLLAETDGYSKNKASRNHNTILINGMGQMSAGRPEGGQWSQPATSGDMTRMGIVTAHQEAGPVVATEGEASGSYLAAKDKSGNSRPALDRYRRTFLWVKGDYILVLDDIRAPQEVDVAWLIQGRQLETADDKAGRFVLKSGTDSCGFQVVSDKELTFAVQDSPADNRGKPLGFRQLKASVKGQALRVASVYNPWQKKALSVQLQPGASPEEATVTVEGDGIKDTWKWKAGADRSTASTLIATRVSGNAAGFPFELNPANSVPAR